MANLTNPKNLTADIINEISIVNIEGGKFIVSDGNKKNNYNNFKNVISNTDRDKLISDYDPAGKFLDVERSLIETALKTGPLMIIVTNISDRNNADILLISFDIKFYNDLVPSSTVQSKKHRCFMFEQKFFDGSNGANPDGLSDSAYNYIRIQIVKENSKFGIIINDITDVNGNLVNQRGSSGVPPSVGTKIPAPKS